MPHQGPQFLGFVVHLSGNKVAGHEGNAGVQMIILGPLPKPFRAQTNSLRVGYGPNYHAGLGGEGQGNVPDLGSQVGQSLSRCRYRLAGLMIQAKPRVHQFGNQANLNPADVTGQSLAIVGYRLPPSVGVMGVIAGDGSNCRGAVGDTPGNGADSINGPAGAVHPVAADPTPGGTQANQTAVGRRPPDRAPGVFSQGSGAEESRGGRPGAGAGCSRVAIQVPGVAGGAVVGADRVAHSEFAHVQLAQQDCSGAA